jgi:hypothetical protein
MDHTTAFDYRRGWDSDKNDDDADWHNWLCRNEVFQSRRLRSGARGHCEVT